ncbi:hypothetical protein [Stella sp.]|uniref:hypothetical protein n=1 Tax=Stella sp. TaxID=2912054 RepID=UPI0035B1973A
MWLDDPDIDLRWILSADILHLQRACERSGVPLTVFRPDQSENSRLALTDRTATVVHPSRDCPSGREFMVLVAHLLVSGQPFNFQVAGFDHRDGSLRGLLRLNPSIAPETLRILTDIGMSQDREIYEEISHRIEEAFAGLRRQISHSPIVLEED